MMWRTLPNVACSGHPMMPLDAPAGQVFATYRPGGCHGHRCCMWTNGLQNTNFSLPLSCRKPIVDFCNGTKKSGLDDIDKEYKIVGLRSPSWKA